MRTAQTLLLLAGILLSASQPVFASSEKDIAKALAKPERSALDRERDARDKPQQVLELAGFKKGMVIADVFGGGGYYSEILSSVVGKKGKVLLINNPQYDAFTKKFVTARLADNRLPNVQYSVVPNDNLGLTANSLDGALIIMSYHDLFYDDPEGWPKIDNVAFIDQIVGALKPASRFLIVDHSAKTDSGITDSKDLHRIDEQYAIAELKARGLQWVGAIDVLRNKDDERSLSVFNPTIKGKTDRFVHVYQKPEK